MEIDHIYDVQLSSARVENRDAMVEYRVRVGCSLISHRNEIFYFLFINKFYFLTFYCYSVELIWRDWQYNVMILFSLDLVRYIFHRQSVSHMCI